MSEVLQQHTLKVDQLGISPLKSGRFLGIDTLEFDIMGMFGDREYMFVEAEPHKNVRYHPGEVAQPGQFLSQREDPNMVQITTEPEFFGITLTHNGSEVEVYDPYLDDEEHLDVSVRKWRGVAVDQGDKAAEWGREVFGRPVRLVKASIQYPRFVENNPDLGVVGFSDGYPLLVTSTGSLGAVNHQLALVGKEPITSARFRPNIVLNSGDRAFVEDYIASFTFESHGLIWEAIRRKPCGRCRVVERNPETGQTVPGVQKALTTLGRDGTYVDQELFGDDKEIFFGQNFIIRPPRRAGILDTGVLLKGMDVQVVFGEATNWRPLAA